MSKFAKTIIFWGVVVLVGLLFWHGVKSDPNDHVPEISYTQFLSQVSDGQIARVMIAGNVVRGRDHRGNAFKVIAPPSQADMIATFQDHGVEIWFKENPEQGWATWLQSLAPITLLAVLWFFMIRQLRKRPTIAGPGAPPENPTRFGP